MGFDIIGTAAKGFETIKDGVENTIREGFEAAGQTLTNGGKMVGIDTSYAGGVVDRVGDKYADLIDNPVKYVGALLDNPFVHINDVLNDKGPLAVKNLKEEIAQTKSDIAELKAQLANKNLPPAERARLSGELAKAEAYLGALNARLSELTGTKAEGTTACKTEGTTGTTGSSSTSVRGNSLDEINADIDRLQSKLEDGSITDNEILLLQTRLQQRLQLLSTFTNVLKMQHDAQMAIINNLR